MNPQSLFTSKQIAALEAAKVIAKINLNRGYVLTPSGKRVPVASERRSGPRVKR